MKNIETIKQEFKAATGRDLPIFTFNGQLGVLYEVYEHGAYYDFLPMEKFLSLDNIDFDLVGSLTSESDYADEGEEITDNPIVNPENGQKLIVDRVWSTVAYNESDEYERELLTETNRYYNWTSDRTRMIDTIEHYLRKFSDEYSWYYDDDEPDEDEIKQQNAVIEDIKAIFKSLVKDWEEECRNYKDPLGWADFNDKTTDFKELYGEAMYDDANDIVCRAAWSAINGEEPTEQK